MLRWILLSAGLTCLLVAVRHAEPARVFLLLRSVGFHIGLVLLPHAAALMLHARAFQLVLRALGHRVPYQSAASVILSSEALLMAVPGGSLVAETATPALLRAAAGVPLGDGIAAVAVKKVAIVSAGAVFVALAAVFGADRLRAVSLALLGRPGLELLVALAALALFIAAGLMTQLLVSGALGARAFALLESIPSAPVQSWLVHRRSNFFQTDERLRVLFRERRGVLATVVALFTLAWVFEGLQAYAALRLVGVVLPLADVLCFDVVMALVRSLVFVLPAGLGVQDAGYVAFLTAVGVVDANDHGAAFVVLMRGQELFWIVAGYALFLIGRRGSPPDSPHA